MSPVPALLTPPAPDIPRPSKAPRLPAAPRAPLPNLHNLPNDLLLHILVHLQPTPAALSSVALTCVRLSRLVRSVRLAGETSLPAQLAPSLHLSPGAAAYKRPHHLKLVKTPAPGDASAVFRVDVSASTAHWHFRLDRFDGKRIDIGVARPRAFRFGSVERASSWSFDCFGRVSLAGKRRTYGRQMTAGDVVGVLYDFAARTLSFLDNGVSMGAVAVSASPAEPLLPFVYWPYHEGETVTLVEGGGVVDVRALHRSVERWRRPRGLPYDGKIIVHTWEERTWYAIEADCETTTLADLWRVLERRHGLAMHLFELICNGVRLENTERRTLRDAGIFVDTRTGSCSSDILLSVPHIVS